MKLRDLQRALYGLDGDLEVVVGVRDPSDGEYAILHLLPDVAVNQVEDERVLVLFSDGAEDEHVPQPDEDFVEVPPEEEDEDEDR